MFWFYECHRRQWHTIGKAVGFGEFISTVVELNEDDVNVRERRDWVMKVWQPP